MKKTHDTITKYDSNNQVSQSQENLKGISWNQKGKDQGPGSTTDKVMTD